MKSSCIADVVIPEEKEYTTVMVEERTAQYHVSIVIEQKCRRTSLLKYQAPVL